MARETERNEMIARVEEEEEIGDDMSQYSERSTHRSFFLLAAAWVDPGRSALQSAEQWCMVGSTK